MTTLVGGRDGQFDRRTTGANGVDAEVDPQRPSVARMYDYFLGGTHNFAADRQAAAEALAAMPELPAIMRVNRDFLCRAVTVAAEAGVGQFLDLGSGIPTEGNVHEVARRLNPAARVVYVDIEPAAVVHGRRMLAADPDADVLLADLTDVPAVLGSEPVRRLIDFGRPVCLLALAVAHFIPDDDLLGRALDGYRDALAPGSMVVISHASSEGDRHRAEQVRVIYNNTTAPMVLRDRAEILALFGGWPLVDPGLTTANRWPGPEAAGTDEVADRSVIVGMARRLGVA